MTSFLQNSQQTLEETEDLIACIVENMQIGRLDDCLALYEKLQSKLLAMALDLDNFPCGSMESLSASLEKFPDAIMRKDCLEELLPPSSLQLPRPPLPPPCESCYREQKSSHCCRVEREHVEPSYKLSAQETQEFQLVADVLADRHRQQTLEEMTGKSKRNYRRWTDSERYSIMVGVYLLNSTHHIASLLENRTENQVRSFINKNFTPMELDQIGRGVMPPPPPNYQPPPLMMPLFADPALPFNRLHMSDFGITCEPVSDGACEDTLVDVLESCCSKIAPKQSSDATSWRSLLCLAMDLSDNSVGGENGLQPNQSAQSISQSNLSQPSVACPALSTTHFGAMFSYLKQQEAGQTNFSQRNVEARSLSKKKSQSQPVYEYVGICGEDYNPLMQASSNSTSVEVDPPVTSASEKKRTKKAGGKAMVASQPNCAEATEARPKRVRKKGPNASPEPVTQDNSQTDPKARRKYTKRKVKSTTNGEDEGWSGGAPSEDQPGDSRQSSGRWRVINPFSGSKAAESNALLNSPIFDSNSAMFYSNMPEDISSRIGFLDAHNNMNEMGRGDESHLGGAFTQFMWGENSNLGLTRSSESTEPDANKLLFGNRLTE